MPYGEILEKIQKAKALADSKKAALVTGREHEPPKKSDAKTVGDSDYRDSVQDWTKPSDLAPDGETLLDLFTRRWSCYSKWPDNVRELDYLHNNYRDLAISSYFEIPTDPTVVLSEWGLPPNLRKNVYLDDESLRENLVIALVPKIKKHGYEGGIIKLMLLISLGLDESRGLSRCPQCKGIGKIGAWECENCHGSGLKAPSLRSRAKACQVTHNTFKRSYMYPYMRQVLPTLSDLEVELGRAMAYLKTT